MRLDRMAGQLQRLRDLMSEVQENHTDIQRLWKAIEAGGIVWPVGIAAAPPEESGCDENKCFGCSDTLPTTLSMEMTYVSGTTQPWFDLWLGTTTFTYWGTYTVGSSKWHIWKSDACRQYGDMSAYGGGELTDKYQAYYISCLACSFRQVRAGEWSYYDTEAECLSASFPGFFHRFSETSYSCSPFYSEGSSLGGAYTIEITE